MKISKKKETVKVLFPCVHGLARGQLVTINCFPVDELKSTIKVVTGVNEEIAGRIIGASRYGETDSRAGTGVMALFSNPLFSGESYGLALAVADKLARFSASQTWTEIYATGSIPADGCGRVEPVRGLLEKLGLIFKQAKPGSLFLYPKSNLFSSPDQIQEKLNLLQDNGIKCIAVATIDDLQGKLWGADTFDKGGLVLHKMSTTARNIPGRVWRIVFSLILAGIGCFLVYLTLSSLTGRPVSELIDKGALENDKITFDKKKTFSHQEIRQGEEKNTGTRSNVPGRSTDNQEDRGQAVDREHRELILESADTDSSLY